MRHNVISAIVGILVFCAMFSLVVTMSHTWHLVVWKQWQSYTLIVVFGSIYGIAFGSLWRKS